MTNLSLERKSAARIAAVQLRYRSAMTDDNTPALDQVNALKAQLANNRDEQKLLVGAAVEPHYAMLEQMLDGMKTHETEIAYRLDEALSEGWSRARMGKLMVALLECAIFELFFYKEVRAAIVTNEYVRLTKRFFGDAEVGFVHAMLSALAKKYG